LERHSISSNVVNGICNLVINLAWLN
jgi:hypothetical protein